MSETCRTYDCEACRYRAESQIVQLRRIAFALESIAAALGERTPRQGKNPLWGDPSVPNTYGECSDCGCRLIDRYDDEDNNCPSCGATLRPGTTP